jgi:hypothetical protein
MRTATINAVRRMQNPDGRKRRNVQPVARPPFTSVRATCQ